MQNKQIGTVYRKIAAFHRVDSRTKAYILEGNYAGTESILKISPYIVAQGAALTSVLSNDGIKVPRNMAWILIHSEMASRDLQGVMTQIARRNYTEYQKSVIALHLLKAVHCTWITQNMNLFYDSGKAQLRCRFMPFEMVGYDEMMKYRGYVEPIFGILGWEFNDVQLNTLYQRVQEDYMVRFNLRTPDDLANYLASGRYRVLSKEVVRYMRDNPKVLKQVVAT